jgi:DNA-binding GntR family transcriptional regulator
VSKKESPPNVRPNIFLDKRLRTVQIEFKIQNSILPGKETHCMPKLGARHRNLDQKVYDRLKSMILERRLLPGEKIFQDKLARELGVSRTPLVNALKILENEKLVSSKPRRGYYVRLFSKAEMIHIFELREVLEGLAARRAAEQISDSQIKRLKTFFKEFQKKEDFENLREYAEEDRRFHSFLIEIGEKEFLSSILKSYNIITFSYQGDFQEGLVRPPEETIHEHRAIIEAISQRDPHKAEEVTRRHLKTTRESLKNDLDQND